MSEENKPTPAAPDPIKQANEEKAKELSALAGKSFRNKANPQTTAKVIKYAGIGVKNGGSFHSLLVESKNPGAIWTPLAKDFLSEWELLETQPEPVSAQPAE